VTKEINGSYKMRLDLKDRGISQGLYLYGSREKDQVAIVRREIGSGMNVLDIGANMGYYVLLEASMLGKSGRIYAFEPHPDNVDMLKENLSLNHVSDRVEFYQRGMSDREGVMEFFVSPRSNLHTLNPKPVKGENKNTDFNGSINIGVTDIAKFLKEKDNINFIRMDIEGHEIEVLRGLERALDGLRIFPSVLFETHITRYDDRQRNMKEVLKRLLEKGYTIDTITSNKEPKEPLRKWDGYAPSETVKTDQMLRGIYRGIKEDDALRYICDEGGVRAVFLKHKRGV
jgi:FkbM family methyltransferase